MKMIAALVQPFMLSKVTHALEEIDGFPGMTVTDARGFGREKSTHEEGAPHRVLEDARKWVFTDIEMIKLVPTKVEVLTYESSRVTLGRDRAFAFKVLKGEIHGTRTVADDGRLCAGAGGLSEFDKIRFRNNLRKPRDLRKIVMRSTVEKIKF